MSNDDILQGIKKIHLSSVRPGQLYVTILIVFGVFVTLGWYFVFRPLQEQLEDRLKRYPTQLASLQELNRTLLVYKSKELPTPKIAEAEFAALKAKLVAHGIQFNVMRLDLSSPAQISMQINEIEFSRWLELVEDLRKNNGLYASDLIIKKNSTNAGIVQVTATLVQTP